MAHPTLIALGVAVIAYGLYCSSCSDSSGADTRDLTGPHDDFLARRFPPAGQWPTASGPQSVPFHNYRSDFFAVWGTVDLAAVRERWMKEADAVGGGLYPIVTTSGRAIVSLWHYEYHETTAGPYREAVIVLATTRNPHFPALPDDAPLEWVESLLFDRNFTSYIAKLWLTSQLAVDWGRDILGANKFRAEITFTMPQGAAGPCGVEIDGGRVWSFSIPPVSFWESLSAQFAMMSAFSFRNLWTAMNAASITLPVTFTPGVVRKPLSQRTLPESMNMLKNDPPSVLQYWPSAATFRAGPEFVPFAFEPRLVQRTTPGRFVLFAPHNLAVETEEEGKQQKSTSTPPAPSAAAKKKSGK